MYLLPSYAKHTSAGKKAFLPAGTRTQKVPTKPQAPPGTWHWVLGLCSTLCSTGILWPHGGEAQSQRVHSTAAPGSLFHPDIRSRAFAATPHSPSGQSRKSSQAQQRARAAKSWILYQTVSFLPTHWVTSGHKALEQSCHLPGLPKVRTACTGKCCLQHTPMGSAGNACGKSQEKWDPFPDSLSLVL